MLYSSLMLMCNVSQFLFQEILSQSESRLFPLRSHDPLWQLLLCLCGCHPDSRPQEAVQFLWYSQPGEFVQHLFMNNSEIFRKSPVLEGPLLENVVQQTVKKTGKKTVNAQCFSF